MRSPARRRPRLLDRLKARGWFAQIYAHDEQWPALLPAAVDAAGSKLIIDHFGVRDISTGVAAPGFQAVLELGRRGNAARQALGPLPPRAAGDRLWTISTHSPKACCRAFGIERCVWGSDWPFLDPSTTRSAMPICSATLARWLPDAADRERVLWRNPVRLFGFGERPA